MKKILLASLLALALLVGTSTATSADESDTTDEVVAEQEQELEQEFEVQCTTGAYGQESTCDVEGKQSGKQNQKIVLRSGEVLGKHTMVDTAIDTRMLLMVAGLMVLGASSFVAYKKI